jgi:alpha-amylase
MPEICLYCQVHQPYRLRRYRLFDVGSGAGYFDDAANRAILRRVADKCYVPANRLLTELIRRSDGRFKLALSLSGTVLEQLATDAPDALASFQELVATGGVELLGETYYHSLSALADRDEFETQVTLHRDAIERFFGRRPTVFRNTELIFSDAIAPLVRDLGFRAALVEGADHVLEWRSPNFVYEAAAAPGLRLLARNYRLSDDIGFRFSNREWNGWPLTADKWADWASWSRGDIVNVFLDYETFGEHQWADTGIFEFLRHWPEAVARRGFGFVQPGTLAARAAMGPLSFSRPTSWADVERDVTAWLGNGMQQAAHDRLYRLGRDVKAAGDPRRVDAWRRLTTSDHVYYMCTKWFSDGDVHKYFSPYDTPYDAYISFMNVLQDLETATPAAVRVGDEEYTERPVIAEMACVA